MATIINRTIEKSDIELETLKNKISDCDNSIEAINKNVNGISDTINNVLFKEV